MFDRAVALQQALEVFWEHGYEGTRVSDLTQAMGINPPSLYASFGSKEALFREAVEFYNAPERSIIALTLTSDRPVRTAIETMLRESARAYADPGTPHGCLVVLSAISYTPDNKGLRDLLASLRDLDRGQLLARLDEAVEHGDIPDSVDTGALATFVMTTLLGLSIQARDGVPLAQLEAAIDLSMLAWDTTIGSRG